MSATERLRDELAACPKVEVPVARRSVSTFLKGFDQGFTGSWVRLLRLATSTSMWSLGRRHPCRLTVSGGVPNPRRIVRALNEPLRMSFRLAGTPTIVARTNFYIAPSWQFWYKALLSCACSSWQEIEVPDLAGFACRITSIKYAPHTTTVRLGALQNQGFRTGYVED